MGGAARARSPRGGLGRGEMGPGRRPALHIVQGWRGRARRSLPGTIPTPACSLPSRLHRPRAGTPGRSTASRRKRRNRRARARRRWAGPGGGSGCVCLPVHHHLCLHSRGRAHMATSFVWWQRLGRCSCRLIRLAHRSVPLAGRCSNSCAQLAALASLAPVHEAVALLPPLHHAKCASCLPCHPAGLLRFATSRWLASGCIGIRLLPPPLLRAAAGAPTSPCIHGVPFTDRRRGVDRH